MSVLSSRKVVDANGVFKIAEAFMSVPKLAVHCSLFNVLPLRGEDSFSKAAFEAFFQMVLKKDAVVSIVPVFLSDVDFWEGLFKFP